MKLIIEIPEKVYKRIQALARSDYFEHDICGNSMLRIANGTPLPKGHGDLIDRKDLIENGISKGFCDWYDEIKMADTIIEAGETKKEYIRFDRFLSDEEIEAERSRYRGE